MADEATEEAGGPGGGSVLKKYGPLAGIVLLAQVVLAWVVITFALKDNVPEAPQEDLMPKPTEITRGGQEEERTALPYYYSSSTLTSITANPAGTNAERFVMFSVQLGLVAYNSDDDPPDNDVTKTLGENADLLAQIGLYDLLIKSLIVEIVRLKTVDELDGEIIHEVRDEIRQRLNKDVFQKLFAPSDDNPIEVEIQGVVFSDIIIQ